MSRRQHNPDTRYSVDPKSGCWNWTGRIDKRSGYGLIDVNGRPLGAHEYSWLKRHGSLPLGLVLDHDCNNKRCVNPEHLVPRTAAANCRRGRNAKLTREKVNEIKASAATGRELAAMYGVTEATISMIRRGLRWREDDKPHCRKTSVVLPATS